MLTPTLPRDSTGAVCSRNFCRSLPGVVGYGSEDTLLPPPIPETYKTSVADPFHFDMDPFGEITDQDPAPNLT